MKRYIILSRLWIYLSLIFIVIFYISLLFYENDFLFFIVFLPLFIINNLSVIPYLRKRVKEIEQETKEEV